MKKYADSIVIGLVYTVIAFTVFLFIPAPITYRIVETYRVEELPIGGKVRIGLILPTSNAHQVVTEPKIRWDGISNTTDYENIRICHLSANSLDGRIYHARVSYLVSLKRSRIQWEDDVRVYDLSPEVNIESEHPKIVTKSKALHGERDSLSFGEISSFVRGHILIRSDTVVSALASLVTQSGTSQSASHLATALARSSGIPCRQVSGRRIFAGFPLFAKKDTIYPGNDRGWCEYHDGNYWQFYDPLAKPSRKAPNQMKMDGTYLAFTSHNSLKAFNRNINSWAGSLGHSIPLGDSHWRVAAGSSSPRATVHSTVSCRKLIDFRWPIVLFIYLIIATVRSYKKIKRIRKEQEELIKETTALLHNEKQPPESK